jgi:uncharacterized membrane protein
VRAVLDPPARRVVAELQRRERALLVIEFLQQRSCLLPHARRDLVIRHASGIPAHTAPPGPQLTRPVVACLIGSAVNIPVARLSSRAVRIEPYISVFGLRYYVPVLRKRTTVLAVNLGGALIPAALPAYLIAHDHLGLPALAAVALVAALVYLVAKPAPGLGIAMPAELPGLFAVIVAAAFHPVAIAALAYVGGTLGTLAGADLPNLGKVRKLGAPVASIGGAGTFDGIFVAGITAVLLAAVI